MKKCPICNKEIEDEAKFCPNCGAQLDTENKKLTWGEKKRQRQIEDQNNLEKAVLHEEELENIPTLPTENVIITPIGTTKQAYNKNIIISVVSSLMILISLAFVILFRFMEINQTLKVFLVFALFLVFFTSIAFLTNSIYSIRMLKQMLKSEFAIKKLEFGKPVKMNVNGNLYNLTINTGCSMCDCQTMHIEEFNGKFVAVCDQNRMHLLMINTAEIKNKIAPKAEDTQPIEANDNSKTI